MNDFYSFLSRRNFVKMGVATIAGLAVAPNDIRSSGLIANSNNEDVGSIPFRSDPNSFYEFESDGFKHTDDSKEYPNIKNQPSSYSGMNRVVLEMNILNGVNILTQKMIDSANTIYIIQYDYILSSNITIPASCILKFEGGSIDGGDNNYTVSIPDSQIIADKRVLKHTKLLYFNYYIHTKWFCFIDGATDDSENLQNAFDSGKHIILDSGMHIVSKTIDVNNVNAIIGGEHYNLHHAIKYTGNSGALFNINLFSNNPYLFIKGVYISGERKTGVTPYHDITCFRLVKGNNGLENNLQLDSVWILYFKTIVFSNGTSYYNSFKNCRFNLFGTCFYNVHPNNFNVVGCRILQGESVVKFIDGDGPANIENCAIELISNAIVSAGRSVVRQLNINNNYIECSCDRLVLGEIKNITVIGNQLQIQGTFRPFEILNAKSAIFINNIFLFDEKRNSVDSCYIMTGGNNYTELLVFLDSFVHIDRQSDEHKRAYKPIGTFYRNEKLIAIGHDPVTGQMVRSLHDAYSETKRPSTESNYVGRSYFDTTLNKPIWWDGSKWVDSTGASI